MSKTHIPLVVRARVFKRAPNKGTIFAIYATATSDSIKGPEVFLTHYKKYQDVFEKKNVDLFSQHRLYDCAIDL
jgi:hypothetical protein